jgi:capsular polysaccharide biosynthesis protein
MQGTRDSLMPVLGTLYPWRRRILYITLGAFILSIIFCLFMKNYYQGKTIFYAASQDLFKPEKVFGSATQEMYYYGSGEDIDRILTVGNSNEILDFLIDSFDLWTVYKIKSGTSKARFKMRNALQENYDILLTKQDALELTIEDRDPERAALMANAARDKIDQQVRNIIKNSQMALSTSLGRSIQNKETLMQGTLDSLMYHRQKSGIYDPEGQNEFLSSRLTEITNTVEREKAALKSLRSMSSLSNKLRDSMHLIEARIAGYQRELSLLNSSSDSSIYSLPRFNANKGKILVLESQYLRSYEQIGWDYEKMKQYNAAVEIDVPALHLVEKAEPPLFKHRPRRSIIVLAVTAAAFLFSLAGVLLIESSRYFDWGEITGTRKNL